jgi:hypothetical protein
MRNLTEKEITIAALRHAGVRMLALILVLGLNLFVAIEFGYDIRNWEWWAISPFASLGTVLGLLFLDEAIGGIR